MKSWQYNIGFIEERLIISIYDYTGKWAKPYSDAGYPVILWDNKIEGDILEHLGLLISQIEETGLQPYGFLFAPPCDDYAGSGARWWKNKDKQHSGFEPFVNSVELHDALVLICLHLIDIYPGIKFWALENPVGRIESRIPELKPFRKLLFNPCDYGDPYTKKTILWGSFNHNLKKNHVEPIFVEYIGNNGRKTRFAPQFARTGGKSEKTKSIRSTTPYGFAKAFFEANR